MAVMARVDEVGGVRRRMITANGDPESGAAGQAAAAQCVFAEQETRHPSLSDCLLVVAQRTRPTTTPLSPSVGARRNHFHFIRFFSRARTWILIHHPPLLVGSLSRSSSAFRATMLLRLALCLSALFASTLTEQQAVQAKRTSACSCPRLFKPVCGTDSQTYNSDCKLKCAQETNPGLRMAYEGICCPQPFCPGHWDPLCDDHGHTHENECMFRYALCVMRKTDNLVLEIASRGECKAGSCDTECPKLTDPVCDTSGRTHENMCWFDNTNCLRRQSGDRSDRPLLIAYKGECVKTSHRPTTTSHFITSIAPTSLPPSPAFAISRRPIGGGDGRADSGAPEPEPPVAVPEPEVNPSLPEQAIGLPEPEPTVNSSSEHLTAVGGVPEPEPPLDAAIPGLNIGTQESHLPVGSSNPLSASPSPVPEPDAEDKLIQPEPTAEPGLNNRSINAASEGSAPEPEPSVAPSSEPEPEFTTGGAPEPEPSVPASSESEPEFTTGGASEPEPSVASSPEPEPKFTTGGAPEPEPSVASSPEPEPEPTTGGAPEPERSVSASSELEPESTTGGAPEPEPSVSASPEPEPEPITGLTPEPELPVSSPESKPTPGSAPFAHAQPTFNAAHPKPTELLPTGAVLSKEILSGPHVALTNSTPVNSLDSSSLPEPEPSRVPEQNETAALWTTEAVDISPHATNDSHDPTLHPFDSDASTNSKEQAMLANCSISTCSSLDGPVCDSAGQTHINKCAFESLNCLDRRRGGVIEETRIVHEGPCELEQEQQAQDEEQVDAPVIQASIDEKLPLLAEGETGHSKPIICSAAACTKEWNPVCDSNGKTHRNRCLFEFSACKLAIKVDGQSDIALAYDGECVTQAPNHDELIFNGCPLCHPQEQVNAVPVCDNTNQTYPSLCIFNAHNCRQKRQNGSGAQRVLVHFGECRSTSPIFALEQEQCPQGCSNEYKPLCDNHATTHPNLCAFQSVNCQLRKRGQDAPYVVGLGECVQPSNAQLPHQSPLPLPRQQITPFPQRAFAPIRANKTEIPFPRRQLTATQFECPEPRCENERRPVCDSDGNVHRNPCLFAWARCLAAQQGKELTLAREGPCSGSCKTERACSNTSEPVCGSDLITYPNICFFRQAQCENKELELLFNGKCELCLKEACPQLGPDADDTLFVCDTNGDTKSRCEFKMVQCIYERKSGQNISELHSGRCCDDADLCPATPDPVCDSRGLTIRNRCVFEVERCKIEKMDGGSLALVKEQPCEMTQPSPAAPSDLSSAALGVGNVPESAALPVIATSLDCKAPCVDDYKPVCGNDGKTYANQCKLSAAMCLSGQLKMAYDGECCDIQCPTQWSPVCDANGVTHENICEFGKARCTAQRTKKQELKIASYGICQQSSCDQPCSTAYEPLCGSNGRTYANKCELQKASCVAHANNQSGSPLKEDYQGECCEDENCPYSFAPVCDSQGHTHSNKCVFKREACFARKRNIATLTVQYEGPCCNQPCVDDAAPVCDGNTTHKNLCLFRIKQCEAQRRGEDLSILYQGQCCAPMDATCAGTEPMCDSDGETHENICGFEHKRCLAMKQQRRNITVAHEGECCAQQACKEEYKPVCDSLGVTHPSMCEFESRKCRYDKTHKNSTMQFAYKGECCDQTCETDWQPVCDQHGALYKNKCDFAVRSCEADRRNGAILLQAPCPARQARRSLRNYLNHL